MRRHALLYRKQRREYSSPFTSRQPLIVHIARQQRLPPLLLPVNWPVHTQVPPNATPSRARPGTDAQFIPISSPTIQVFTEVPSQYSQQNGVEEVGTDESLHGFPFRHDLSEAVKGAETDEPLSDISQFISDRDTPLSHLIDVPSLMQETQQADINKRTEEYVPEAVLSARKDLLPATEDIPLSHVQQSNSTQDQVYTNEQSRRQENARKTAEVVDRTRAQSPRGRIEEHLPQIANSQARQADSAASHDGEKTAKTFSPTAKNEKMAAPADNLFLPQQHMDRSPQSWVARLKRAAGIFPSDGSASLGKKTQVQSGKQPVERQDMALADQVGGFQSLPQARAYAIQKGTAVSLPPTPLSQRARQFLQPLVGIDPASVHIYRNELAEQLTDTYRADAITAGEDVIIGRGYPEDTPETLGLLAHELTHVARQRKPRFVPPVASSGSTIAPGMQRQSSGFSSKARARNALRGNRASATGRQQVPEDEEELAQFVERTARVTAREQSSVGAASSTRAPYEVAMPTQTMADSETTAHAVWGNLPAPWEPLPDWLVSPSFTQETSLQTSAPVSLPTFTTSQANGSGASVRSSSAGGVDAGSVTGQAQIQRAGSERDMDEGEAPGVPTDQPVPKAPEADLDVLARQVYTLLKRRLGVESRRES